MLIKIDKKDGKDKNLLPKLKVRKSATASRKRVVADDSAVVAERMAKLFSAYDCRVVTTEKDLLDYISRNYELGLDTETTGLDIFKNELVGFSLGTTKDCIYVPLNHKVGKNYAGDIKAIATALEERKLYGFNAKFDMKALKLKAGLEVRFHWCGYLAARLMNSSEPSNSLKGLYVKYVDPNDETYSFGNLFNMPFDAYDPEVVEDTRQSML